MNNTTVWSDPAAGSHIEFSSFEHFARTAERARFDFLFLAEGLRLREQGGALHDLDVVGRPDTFTVLAALDETAGEPFTSDAPVFTGTPAALAERLLAWQSAGLTGFRLRPGTLPHDLEAITRGLVPELRALGRFRTAYDRGTLRDRLGLPRPANRYAGVRP